LMASDRIFCLSARDSFEMLTFILVFFRDICV